MRRKEIIFSCQFTLISKLNQITKGQKGHMHDNNLLAPKQILCFIASDYNDACVFVCVCTCTFINVHWK